MRSKSFSGELRFLAAKYIYIDDESPISRVFFSNPWGPILIVDGPRWSKTRENEDKSPNNILHLSFALSLSSLLIRTKNIWNPSLLSKTLDSSYFMSNALLHRSFQLRFLRLSSTSKLKPTRSSSFLSQLCTVSDSDEDDLTWQLPSIETTTAFWTTSDLKTFWDANKPLRSERKDPHSILKVTPPSHLHLVC